MTVTDPVDKKNHGFRVGQTVMYLGRNHDGARGRIGTIRWLRHNEHGRLEVRVDYATEVTRRIGAKFWDVFIGHETRHLAQVIDSTMYLTEEAQEVLVSDLNPEEYGVFAEGITGVVGPGAVISVPDGLDGTLLPNMAQKEPSIRDDVLDESKSLISGDREADYGDLTENFGRIADIWSAILGVKVPTEKVALMMAGVKLARLAGNPKHRDSWVDIAGYAALGAEVVNAKRKGF